MRGLRKIILIGFFPLSLLTWESALADEPVKSIVEHITEIPGNEINQPDSLSNLLKPNAALDSKNATKENGNMPAGKAVGYRVQVFSDGNQRTAKGETQKKAAIVSSRFPTYRTYTSYAAPFWRLRVGDFRSRREAEEAAANLKAAFPAYKNEIRVVRDRINVKE